MSDIPERQETPAMRADRNWTELTQELRVSQTGVQILTAFLLILPFQQRFPELIDGAKLTLYLVLVSLAIITTILMVAPVSLHRFLFQRGRKVRMVHISNRLTTLALVFLGLTIAGCVAFIFAVVLGQFWGWIAAAGAVVLLAGLWLILPWLARVTRDPHEEG